jgi:cation diffusion facilitator CzcD-associated flavoprotein CzcO
VTETDTVVVGASAAGLAVAACLRKRGLDSVLLERAPRIATAWRGHYDRLHLHTHKGGSQLPYLAMPAGYPRYPSRDQFVAYLEAYCAHHQLAPRFSEEVRSVARLDDGRWETTTGAGVYRARQVVIATGRTERPVRPPFDGEAQYGGQLVHSSQYRNGAAWKDRDVLVVGFGNSGCEIAVDLHEHGARPSLAVRSPVNIVPREVLGLPLLTVSRLFGPLPPGLADWLGRPLIAAYVGDFTKYGLKRLPYGAMTQIKRHGRVPMIDIGALKLIREGKIRVHPGVARFTKAGVKFDDGVERAFDAVVLATGYAPSLGFLGDALDQLVDEQGIPRNSGHESALPGLYFCGYYVAATGMLREISVEARRIAGHIASRRALAAS